MSVSASGSGSIEGPAEVATALARHTRTLDDRLTLLAVRMTYVALSFFVACWYFAQTFLQIVNSNGMWLPRTLHRPLGLGIVEMALVLIGGLVYFWGQWAGLYQRNFGRLRLALYATSLLGIAAVIVHIIVLHKPGFSLQDGGYASVFIGSEGAYTVLLGLTVIALLGLTNRARLGLFEKSGIAIEAFGEFWGWISAVALLNFLALYVTPFFPIA